MNPELYSWFTDQNPKSQTIDRTSAQERKFIRSYITTAHSLTELLKKDALFWKNESQKAFEHLKRAITYSPVLEVLNFLELLQLKLMVQVNVQVHSQNKMATPLHTIVRNSAPNFTIHRLLSDNSMPLEMETLFIR